MEPLIPPGSASLIHCNFPIVKIIIAPSNLRRQKDKFNSNVVPSTNNKVDLIIPIKNKSYAQPPSRDSNLHGLSIQRSGNCQYNEL